MGRVVVIFLVMYLVACLLHQRFVVSCIVNQEFWNCKRKRRTMIPIPIHLSLLVFLLAVTRSGKLRIAVKTLFEGLNGQVELHDG